MVGLRCWLALVLLLLGSTPSCLGQDDPGPPGEGPEGGPPPDSARSVRRQDEGPQGEAPQGEGPDGNPAGNRNLDSFLRSRENSLNEREEEILEQRGTGDWLTRLGKRCESGRGVYGYDGCQTYPGSTFFREYLWCYTEGSTEWESCCSWSCTYYSPGWGGSPYYYCYINSAGSVWDYCDPDKYRE